MQSRTEVNWSELLKQEKVSQMMKFHAPRRISAFSFTILALLSAVTSPSSAHATRRPIALVYQGPGACTRWKCHEAAAAAAYARGFDIRFVTPARLTPEVFSGATLWMQPGGVLLNVEKKLSLSLPNEMVR
jgi:hypothetical protein